MDQEKWMIMMKKGYLDERIPIEKKKRMKKWFLLIYLVKIMSIFGDIHRKGNQKVS